MLFKELALQWLAVHELEISESTYLLYLGIIERLSCQVGNACNTKKEDLQGIVLSLAHREFKTNTIINYMKVINMVFNYAVSAGYIAENPCKDVVIPKGKAKEINPFTLDEIHKLLETPMKLWLKDAVKIAFLTGLRKGEIFALTRNDIDFNSDFISVVHTQTQSKKGIILGEPKTKRSKRRVDCCSSVMDIFQRRLYSSKSGFVFEHNDKMRIPWCISNTIKAKCRCAGIPEHSFHDLRHGHATYLLARNVNPKIVQERLGHSDINMTMDTYSHFLPGMQRVAVEKVEELHL